MNSSYLSDALKRAHNEWELATGTAGGDLSNWHYRDFIALKLAESVVAVRAISTDDIARAAESSGLFRSVVTGFDAKSFKRCFAKLMGCRDTQL